MVGASVDQPPRSHRGFIDAHSHLRSTPYADHGVWGASLEEGLIRMMAMTDVPVADDVFVACSDLISHGVTGVQMMFHTFGDPDDYLSLLDQTLEGVRRSGIRALIILGTTDQAEFAPPGVSLTDLMPEWTRVPRRLTSEEFADVVHTAQSAYPDITFGVGPVGPQWCSDGLLRDIAELAGETTRIHTHMAESKRQTTWAGSLMDRMRDVGLLRPTTSLAHAVWLTDSEQAELADLGVSLVTCPVSNALLGAGTAPVDSWHRNGVSVAVGMDSADQNISAWETARRAMDSEHAFTALTTGGEAATGIDTGGDLVEWADSTSPRPTSVTIDGKDLVVDGTLTQADEVEGLRRDIAQLLADDQPNRTSRLHALEQVMPAYLERIDRGGQ